jgi:predicted acyl esterase
MQLEWFDHYVRNGGTTLPRSPVTLFVMGEHTWRDEDDWPSPGARSQAWYLRSDGDANTAGGGGTVDRPRGC